MENEGHRLAWLDKLDQYLEVGRPAGEIMQGALAFYALLPQLPVRAVEPVGLPALFAEHDLAYPESYARLVDLHPAEIGADTTARYVIANQRDPLRASGDTDLLTDRDLRRAWEALGGAPRTAPRSSTLDALDRLDRRLSEARAAGEVARRRFDSDLLAVATLDGYTTGLECARQYLIADPRSLMLRPR